MKTIIYVNNGKKNIIGDLIIGILCLILSILCINYINAISNFQQKIELFTLNIKIEVSFSP